MQEFTVFLYNIGTNTGNAQNTAWSAFWIDCWLIIIDFIYCCSVESIEPPLEIGAVI